MEAFSRMKFVLRKRRFTQRGLIWFGCNHPLNFLLGSNFHPTWDIIALPHLKRQLYHLSWTSCCTVNTTLFVLTFISSLLGHDINFFFSKNWRSFFLFYKIFIIRSCFKTFQIRRLNTFNSSKTCGFLRINCFLIQIFKLLPTVYR